MLDTRRPDRPPHSAEARGGGTCQDMSTTCPGHVAQTAARAEARAGGAARQRRDGAVGAQRGHGHGHRFGRLRGAAGGTTHRFSARICFRRSVAFQVRLWDVSLAQPMLTSLPGHSAPISCLAIAPDDDLVVSGGDEGKVRTAATRGRSGKLSAPLEPSRLVSYRWSRIAATRRLRCCTCRAAAGRSAATRTTSSASGGCCLQPRARGTAERSSGLGEGGVYQPPYATVAIRIATVANPSRAGFT